MVSTEGCGRPRWKVTSRSPLVVTCLRLNHHDFRGFLRSFDSSPSRLSPCHLPSAEVNCLPSCHFTPSRSLKVRSLPSLLHAHSVARSGTILSGRSCLPSGSNTTRLL